MGKKSSAVSTRGGAAQHPWMRIVWELLAAALLALLIELFFNFPALTGGYTSLEITDTTVNEDGKLVYQAEFADPVYVKKLTVEAAITKNTSYRIEAVVVNDFGEEESLSVTDRMVTELDAAVTNIGKEVKELQVVFNHGEWLTISGVYCSNTFFLNPFRLAFFFLVSFAVFLLFIEKKLLLKRMELFYLLLAVGFGSILAAASGSYATTWDEEVHYGIVHRLSPGAQENDSQAELLNCTRKTWGVNTIEEASMVNAYLNRIAAEKGDSHVSTESAKGYLTHFPMIIAYTVGRLLKLPYTMRYLWGRLGNLLFCAACMFLAIRLAERKKILLAVVGLLPTVLFQDSMYTYDGVCFSCMTLGIVLCVGAVGKKGRGQLRNLLAAVVLFGISCAAKPVYFAVFLLLFPALRGKRPSVTRGRKRKYLRLGLLLVLGVGGVLVLCYLMQPLLTNLLQGNASYGGDTRGGDTGLVGQLLSILRNPVAFVKMFIKEVFSFDNFRNYGEEGENAILVLNQMFLNLYVLGTMKEAWTLLLFPLLLLIFLAEPEGEGRRLRNGGSFRLLNLAVVAISVVLIWLAMYLTFTPIGSSSIEGVQARYFLPLVLPFAYLVENDRITLRISRLLYTRIALGTTILLTGVCTYTFLISGVVS